MMKISAVQHQPMTGDFERNIIEHLSYVDLALSRGTDLVFFPELSLTGYEPGLARSLATVIPDPRLDAFQQKSDSAQISIGVGLPLLVGQQVRIAMAWFRPAIPPEIYAKQDLHDDEKLFFTPGDQQFTWNTAGHTLAPAICYESLQEKHADDAAALGADIYLASVAKPPRNLETAMHHFPKIAAKHHMFVIMANCIGHNDDFISAGGTAAWDRNGKLLAQMDDKALGLVTLDTDDDSAVVDIRR